MWPRGAGTETRAPRACSVACDVRGRRCADGGVAVTATRCLDMASTAGCPLPTPPPPPVVGARRTTHSLRRWCDARSASSVATRLAAWRSQPHSSSSCCADLPGTPRGARGTAVCARVRCVPRWEWAVEARASARAARAAGLRYTAFTVSARTSSGAGCAGDRGRDSGGDGDGECDGRPVADEATERASPSGPGGSESASSPDSMRCSGVSTNADDSGKRSVLSASPLVALPLPSLSPELAALPVLPRREPLLRRYLRRPRGWPRRRDLWPRTRRRGWDVRARGEPRDVALVGVVLARWRGEPDWLDELQPPSLVLLSVADASEPRL